MSPLPSRIRRLTPERLRNDVRARSIAVGLGVIPPRFMHSGPEAELLVSLAREARVFVEIGVYEGGSAAACAAVMGPGQTLHLIDPYGRHPDALPSGWGATERATRRVVRRAAGSSGPQVVWHITTSRAAAVGWREPVDLVFIDGDHSEAGCRLDWDLWHPLVAPGGVVLFHDARASREGGVGLPGPTSVVDALFRGAVPALGWAIVAEVDSMVAVRRAPAAG